MLYSIVSPNFIVWFPFTLLVIGQYVFAIVCKPDSDASNLSLPQPAITCSKSTIETLEQGVKYVQC